MLVMMPEVINQRISSKHPAERSSQYIYIHCKTGKTFLYEFIVSIKLYLSRFPSTRMKRI